MVHIIFKIINLAAFRLLCLKPVREEFLDIETSNDLGDRLRDAHISAAMRAMILII